MDNIFKRSLGTFENLALGSTFAVLVVAMVTQVVNRTFIQASMPWLEELAVYAMLYLVLLGTAAGLRDGSQLSITLLQERLTGRARLALETIAKLVVVVVGVLLLIASYNLVMQQVSSGQQSAALNWPMWIPYGAFLIAFLLITVVQSVALVVHVRALIANDPSLIKAVEDDAESIEKVVENEIVALTDTHDEDGAR